MNTTSALIIFTASLVAVALLTYAVLPRLSQQTSGATTTADITYERVSNLFRVVSAYTDGKYTYFLVSGYSGQVPLRALTAIVDGVPYDVNVRFYKDLDGDGLLDPSDVAYIVISDPLPGEHRISFVSQSVSIPTEIVDVERRYWKYRRVVTISNATAVALTDFQVRVELNSSNFDFTHLQPDCSDIRFTDTSGNLLSYWIETCDVSGRLVVAWVKVPSIPASGDVNIYLYYGISGVFSFSDPYATFDFFDDIETWDGWVQNGSGVISQSSEEAYDGRFSLKKDLYGDPNGGYKNIGLTITYPFVFEAWVKRTYLSGANYDRIGMIGSTGAGYGIAVGHGASPAVGIDVRSSFSSVTLVTTSPLSSDPVYAWYFVRLIWNNGEINAFVYSAAGALLGSASLVDTTYSSFSNVYVYGGYTYFVDQIRVRKYANPEPTATVGPEEAGAYAVG